MTRKFPGGIDLQGQQGKNAADGTAASDLATYGQVQAAIRGLDVKDPVRVVSSTNQAALTGLLTIDGVTLVAGDRVALIAQTTGSQNGIWVAGTGAWVRATDSDESAEITPGFSFAVLSGTQKGTGSTQANPVQYILTNTGAVTIGTTALTFAVVGAAGASSAPTSGSGAISVAGTAVSFVPKASGGILQDGTGAYLDTAYAGFKKPYAADVPASATATMTHNLGTLDRLGEPLLYIKSTGEVVDGDILMGLNADTITFPSAPTAAFYRYSTSA